MLLALISVLAATLFAIPSDGQPDGLRFRERQEMVERLRIERDITDNRLLIAMNKVMRHQFVPPELGPRAYEDEPLRLSDKLTIHQPYVVALMTSLLKLSKGSKVLEIGTGTGYHSAILGQLAAEVFSIEIDRKIAEQARTNLERFGAHNVQVKTADGYLGWPRQAPFDAIILTAAPPRIPLPLLDQLRVGGVMVVPVGTVIQELIVLTKTKDGIRRETSVPVSLPRMSGEVQNRPTRP